MGISIEYIAGLFDGEGSVGIIQSKRKTGHYFGQWELRVTLSNNHPLPLLDIQNQFGGCMYTVHPKGTQKRVMYRWYCSTSKAGPFLMAILHAAIIKKEQILVALQFYTLIQERIDRAGKRASTSPLLEADILLRQALKDRISQLNNSSYTVAGDIVHPLSK